MHRYFLPKPVHFCFTCDGAVFLHMRRDEYVGLNRHEAQTLRRLIANGSANDLELASLAEVLVANGLLTTSMGKQTRPIEPTFIEAPRGLLLDVDALSEVPAISLRHVLRFFLSCVSVWAVLRVGGLACAIRRLQMRKTRGAGKSRQADATNSQLLIRIFVHLRLFAYTAREHCLFDSLVLCDFLQRCGVVPTCVFGVRTLPFGAHCWVLVNGRLATESNAQQLSIFSPILVL